MEITDKLYVAPYLMIKEDLSKEIINYFDNAIKYNTFFFGSKEDKKIVGYGCLIPHTLLKEIADQLSLSKGLNIVYGDCYCAGPAHGLIIYS